MNIGETAIADGLIKENEEAEFIEVVREICSFNAKKIWVQPENGASFQNQPCYCQFTINNKTKKYLEQFSHLDFTEFLKKAKTDGVFLGLRFQLTQSMSMQKTDLKEWENGHTCYFSPETLFIPDLFLYEVNDSKAIDVFMKHINENFKYIKDIN